MSEQFFRSQHGKARTLAIILLAVVTSALGLYFLIVPTQGTKPEKIKAADAEMLYRLSHWFASGSWREVSPEGLWSKFQGQVFAKGGQLILVKKGQVIELAPDDGFTMPHTDMPIFLSLKSAEGKKPALAYIKRTCGSGRPVICSTCFIIFEESGRLSQEPLVSNNDGDLSLASTNDETVSLYGDGFAESDLVFDGGKFLLRKKPF